jgi:ribonuclease J
MKITVHRPNQIGGCITEITSAKGTRIIIDVGSNLPGCEGETVDIARITKDCNAVFITHYHGDHIGEYEKVDADTPIHMGKIAHKIFLNLCETLKKDVDKVKKFKTFIAKDRIEVGDMVITPYRVDHSAYDAYMFLIEADGKRVLHTGDFRTHGWTGKGVEPMLSHYVKKVDALICEGTMLSRPSENVFSERDLYYKARDYMKANKNVFVLCSSTNIDALASFCKAARDFGKLVVTDSYQKRNLEIVTDSAPVGLYKFPDIEVIDWLKQKNCINIMQKSTKGFCMFVRPRDAFKKIMKEFPDSFFIYSVWEGYLKEKTRNKEIYEFIPRDADGNLVYNYLHTSGHAYEDAIINICDIIKPDVIYPIHSEESGRFEELAAEGKIKGRVERFKDGEDTKEI